MTTTTNHTQTQAELSSEHNAIVVPWSGGLDSTTLIWWLRKLFPAVRLHTLTFNYGQRHTMELAAVARMSAMYGIRNKVIDISNLKYQRVFQGSSQTDDTVPVPEGHYAAENMKTTIVPNRNMIFLSIAAAYCQSLGGGTVVYGAHAGDHAIYPDCRPPFVAAMRRVLELATTMPGEFKPRVHLVAPFLHRTKTEIVRIGAGLPEPPPWSETWSCYKGYYRGHCGVCGTCVERREAFQQAGVVDPTTYIINNPVKLPSENSNVTQDQITPDA